LILKSFGAILMKEDKLQEGVKISVISKVTGLSKNETLKIKK